jgi:hypothetical protein
VSVSISGPTLITAIASVPIQLSASAAENSCASADVLLPITYQWELLNYQLPATVPINLQSSSIRIPPKTLPGRSEPYLFVVTARLTGTSAGQYISFRLNSPVLSLASNATVEVEILQTPIVASIANGFYFQQSTFRDMVLDASSSYDPDQPNATLNFQWQCSDSLGRF